MHVVDYVRWRSEKMQSMRIQLEKGKYMYVEVHLKLLNHEEDNGWKRVWKLILQKQNMIRLNNRLVNNMVHGMHTFRKLLFVDFLYVMERNNSNEKLYKDIT